jgi:beta-mannanase
VPFERRNAGTARPLGLVALALLLAVALLGLSAPAGAGAKKIRKISDARALGRTSCTQARRNLIARRSSGRRRNLIARRCGTSHSSGPLYWGAWIGDQLTGIEAPWDMSAVSRFEAMTGKSASLINFSSPFADCSKSPCSFYDFPNAEMEQIRQHGSIPFFSWGSQATPASLNEPDFQLSDVIAGRYDSYIGEWAEAARDWGHPFFLRFNWEMNGNWFAWMEGVNGNQPGEYVTAWRHVHDIFTAVGATNVSWVWCPNVDPGHKLRNLASLYPGDSYVDWSGLDGYNFGTNPAAPRGWMTFNQLFRSTYDEITEEIAPSKPLVVSEVGSSEDGGSKAQWIAEALKSARTEYPQLRGLLWFEKYDDGMDWPIETSSSATAAFASGIQSSAYLGNSFASMGSSTIQPAG